MEDGQSRFEQLRKSYRLAFHEWRTSLDSLRFSMAGSPDSTVLLDRSGRVSAAERDYHQRRDEFAAYLMERKIRRTSEAVSKGISVGEFTHQVEHLAFLLWMQAGQPKGTAESDWYRAEEMLRGCQQPA